MGRRKLNRTKEEINEQSKLRIADTIKNIKMELNEGISIDTIKKWEKNCPKCNNIIYYTRKDNRDVSIRKNKILNDCKHLEHRINRFDGIVR